MAGRVDVEEVRTRRYIVKDILNTNLLSLEARKKYEAEYAETGALLEKALKPSSE